VLLAILMAAETPLAPRTGRLAVPGVAAIAGGMLLLLM
jgi:hypothetical protein